MFLWFIYQDDRNVLLLASLRHGGELGIVRLLVEKGAQLDIQNQVVVMRVCSYQAMSRTQSVCCVH